MATAPEDVAATLSYRRFDVSCDLRLLATGASKTWSWRVWLQPSEEGPFHVQADLRADLSPDAPLTLPAQAQLQIPAANMRPVIFIPGISGSYLDDRANGENLWLGSGVNGPLNPSTDYGRLSQYPNDIAAMSPQPAIIATDAIRKALGVVDTYGSLIDSLQKLGYTEYQVEGQPARRTGSGCDMSQQDKQPKLFVFAYDWRKDNAETSQVLNEYMQCIRQFYPNTQVDIVAHSMGGLVMRRYILDHPDIVHTAVTVATPYLGAPKALNTLETGEFLGWFMHPFFIKEDQLKAIAGSLPGAAQLAPSRLYYNLLPSGKPESLPLGEAGWDWNNNGNADDVYDYDEQVRVLDNRYGRGVFPVGSIGKNFHDYSSPSGTQDDWTDDKTGVRYYVIYGQTERDTTITAVRADDWVGCRSDTDPNSVFGKCFIGKGTSLSFGPGDGTVPSISATRQNQSQNYAPHLAAIPYQANGGSQTHTGLPGNVDVQKKIKQYLIGLPMTWIGTHGMPIVVSPLCWKRISPSLPAY